LKHQEGFFKGVRDANIYFQGWLPENEPRAVLLIVHGLAEHCGRYMNVVNHFVPLGYAVYGIDHLGHGKSDGKRVYVERFNDYTNTLKVYFDMIHGWQPDKPIFLVGHSMGGLISAVYLLDHQAELAGAVLFWSGCQSTQQHHTRYPSCGEDAFSLNTQAWAARVGRKWGEPGSRGGAGLCQ